MFMKAKQQFIAQLLIALGSLSNVFVTAAKPAGAGIIYVAMFDEVDEGTAIFKCANELPVGPAPFLTYEGLPSDFYLRLTGEGVRLLRGEIPVSNKLLLPIPNSAGRDATG